MSESSSLPSAKPTKPRKVDLENNPTFGKYVLSSKGEIRAYLKTLADKTRMVTAYQKNGEEFFLSTVLGFDNELEHVFIERSRIEPDWLKSFSDDFLCDSDLERVQIQFTLKNPVQAEYEGESAWMATFPEKLVRLQRREFFRLSIPMNRPVFCRVKGLPTSGQETRVELADISGSGMGFSAAIELTDRLKPGQEFAECELTLPKEPPFTLGIVIRNTYETTSRSGVRALRVGAEFTQLTSARVNLIQRYITGIERERRAKAAGDL